MRGGSAPMARPGLRPLILDDPSSAGIAPSAAALILGHAERIALATRAPADLAAVEELRRIARGDTPIHPRWLTPSQAAEALGLTARRVRQLTDPSLAEWERLESRREGRAVLVSEASVRRLRAQRRANR